MPDDVRRMSATVDTLRAALADVPFPTGTTEITRHAGTTGVPLGPDGREVTLEEVLDQLPVRAYDTAEDVVTQVRAYWQALEERFAEKT